MIDLMFGLMLGLTWYTVVTHVRAKRMEIHLQTIAEEVLRLRAHQREMRQTMAEFTYAVTNNAERLIAVPVKYIAEAIAIRERNDAASRAEAMHQIDRGIDEAFTVEVELEPEARATISEILNSVENDRDLLSGVADKPKAPARRPGVGFGSKPKHPRPTSPPPTVKTK